MRVAAVGLSLLSMLSGGCNSSACGPLVDLQGDSANCGTCGLVCPAGALCLGGACSRRQTRLTLSPTPQSKVDVLFMLDNSGPDPELGELANRFPLFLRPFQDLADSGIPADLHIGVVTSDYGAGATGAPGCSPSPGGQMGKLQALGVKAPQSCKKPTGANFIQYRFDDHASNLPPGQDVAATFTCMASVGAQGCGFEHPLESVYAALENDLPENAGFLRADALLAVFFLTDEDDASAPATTLVFDKNRTAQFGYEDSFRATHFGVMCGDAPALAPYDTSRGPLAHCRPATNPPGELYDVHRYTDLFTAPAAAGGLKADPHDVFLFAIDGPETPFEVVLSNPGIAPGTPYQPCPQLNETSNPPCVPVLQHSCQNPQQPSFFADPAVRLNAVVLAAKNAAVSSICDSDYSAPVAAAAAQIAAALGPACVRDALPVDPADPSALVANCVVRDVTTHPDGSATTSLLGRCDAGASPACWRLAKSAACAKLSPQGAEVTIERAAPPPASTRTEVVCDASP